MPTSTWVILGILLFAGVLIEVGIRRARREVFDRESHQWRQVEETIVRDLASPGRADLVREALRTAEINRQQLNQLCMMTSTALDAPAAVVTLVEVDGQRWLAYYGADWVGEDIRAGLIAPLNTSYCQYVIAQDEPLAIEDSYKDPRVASATQRTKDDVRAYLGAPVHTATGEPIGSLCVFDFRARRWSLRDTTTLRSFAALVTL